ncbi:hypothetical protein DPMN_020175 [Dreissena polymorpha]|uniref:Uncharacterized protein n=1 Tax=Dreissena polymorpha TaxID=45954 RepID=A0A9D4NLP6_DREPO|nr:hypothetical protein DPMN_020175 [Dreissena polymorpha]
MRGDRLYITCYWPHNKLLTLARDGTLLATYSDEALVYPRGQVLVCGYLSHTVLQLANLATQDDGHNIIHHCGTDGGQHPGVQSGIDKDAENVVDKDDLNTLKQDSLQSVTELYKPMGLNALQVQSTGKPMGLNALQVQSTGKPMGLNALQVQSTGKPMGLNALQVQSTGKPMGLNALQCAHRLIQDCTG